MHSFVIRLSCINQVGAFVKAAEILPCEVTVRAGGLAVNGKSLMGIVSLGAKEPVTVEVHGSQQDAQTLRDSVEQYIVAS